MFISTKKLEELEKRLKELEKAVVAYEYTTDVKKTYHYYGFSHDEFVVEKLSIKEVVNALLKHLNISLKKQHISASTEISVVKNKRKANQ